GGSWRIERMCLCVRPTPPSRRSTRPFGNWGSAAPSPRRVPPHLSNLGGALMMDQQKPMCPQCSRIISPEDTFVFGHGLLGHLDCRRPRVLSAEERTLLFLHCRDHKVAECSTCRGQFLLWEVASLDRFGVRLHECLRCHADLTDSLRAHLYGCTMLPAEVR